MAEFARCQTAVASVGTGLNAVAAPMQAAFNAQGPLRGLPYVAKDIFDRVTRRAQWGGARSPGVASSDASILSVFDAAGGSQVAVAGMTTLAYEPSGHNTQLGRTRNPWHPEVISGGSSSGSAALVAAGCAHLGIGSDTGGSVRIPAACCGLVGLKPGWGVIPTNGTMPLAPSLDCVGFMARRADDLIHTWPAIAPAAKEAPTIGKVMVLAPLIAQAAPVVRDAIAQALRVLAASGVVQHHLDETGVIAEADRDVLTIMQAEAARLYGDLPLAGDPVLAQRIGKGTGIGADELAAALARRDGLLEAFLASWRGCDAAVLPVLPMPVPLATEVDPDSSSFSARTLYALSVHTRFVNALGLPAIAIPVGFDARGVPLSMQVIGRPGAELPLLKLADDYQRATDWLARVPSIVEREDSGASA
ncbi:amidase [Tardiphaga sp.]|uniref:amidase n=1 Tax=Tardiphaga sp. TaxID=1926292 RepID=UPI0037DA31DE